MPKVTELYAYVMADTDEDDEGIPAIYSDGVAMPLVGADMERAGSLREVAQQIATEAGRPVRLLHAKELEVVETLEP